MTRQVSVAPPTRCLKPPLTSAGIGHEVAVRKQSERQVQPTADRAERSANPITTSEHPQQLADAIVAHAVARRPQPGGKVRPIHRLTRRHQPVPDLPRSGLQLTGHGTWRPLGTGPRITPSRPSLVRSRPAPRTNWSPTGGDHSCRSPHIGTNSIQQAGGTVGTTSRRDRTSPAWTNCIQRKIRCRCR